MEAKIRAAELKDVSFIAWAELQASRSNLPRGFWDIWLQRPERECLAFLEHLAQTGPGPWYHCSAFLVADLDGRAVAALCAYEGKESTGITTLTAVLEATQK